MADIPPDREAGERLRRFISERMAVEGIPSFRALAGKAGVGPITLTQWWSQGTIPKRDTLALVAPHLGVAVADLQAAYEGRLRPPPVDLIELATRLEAQIGRLSDLIDRQERLAGLAAAAGAAEALEEAAQAPDDDESQGGSPQTLSA